MIVRELLAVFGVKFEGEGAKQAEKGIEQLKNSLKELLGIVGAGAAVRSFAQFMTSQIAMADALGDTAAMMGIQVEALQELQFAGQDVGLSAEGVNGALLRLSRTAAEAAAGNEASKETFKELGVELEDGQGNLRSVDELVMDVADGMGRAKSEGDRMRLGFKLFGREGAKFTATMAKGSAGLEEFREQARELGGVLSTEQVDAADKADKALNRFKFAFQGLKNELSSQFMPGFTKVVEIFQKFTSVGSELAAHSSIVAAAFATIGGAIAVAFGPKMLTAGVALARVAIPLLLIALVLDEIITTFRGGDTVIRTAIDGLLGDGATATGVAAISKAFSDLKTALLGIPEELARVDKAYGSFSDRLERDLSKGVAGNALGVVAQQMLDFMDVAKQFIAFMNGTAKLPGGKGFEAFMRVFAPGVFNAKLDEERASAEAAAAAADRESQRLENEELFSSAADPSGLTSSGPGATTLAGRRRAAATAVDPIPWSDAPETAMMSLAPQTAAAVAPASSQALFSEDPGMSGLSTLNVTVVGASDPTETARRVVDEVDRRRNRDAVRAVRQHGAR